MKSQASTGRQVGKGARSCLPMGPGDQHVLFCQRSSPLAEPAVVRGAVHEAEVLPEQHGPIRVLSDRSLCWRQQAQVKLAGEPCDVMDFYFHFWPFCMLSHIISPIIYLISKETGPSPSFFIVKFRRRQKPLDESNLRTFLLQPFPTDVADKTMGCTDLAV